MRLCVYLYGCMCLCLVRCAMWTVKIILFSIKLDFFRILSSDEYALCTAKKNTCWGDSAISRPKHRRWIFDASKEAVTRHITGDKYFEYQLKRRGTGSHADTPLKQWVATGAHSPAAQLAELQFHLPKQNGFCALLHIHKSKFQAQTL